MGFLLAKLMRNHMVIQKFQDIEFFLDEPVMGFIRV